MKENLIQQLRFCSTLPSLPAVALKIIDLANSADTDMIQISHYIALDPALAAKILKTANSPLYKSRRTSSNIRQAVCVLGTHAVISIALSFSLTKTLMQHTESSIGKESSDLFWRRSIIAALACKALGNKINLKMADDLFLAGLLQDIGILAFFSIIPEAYAKIYSSAASHDALLQAEYEAFETGHDELGYTLLKRWNLPSYVAIACMTSHNQSSSQKGEPTIADCVAASGYIADYFLNPSDTEKIAQTMTKLYARLNLDGQALLKVIAKIKDELRTIEELFEFSICSESELNALMSEAQELLSIQSLIKIRDLEDKTQRDGLTGAHNRAFFDSVFEREFIFSTQHSTPLTIAMIDVDHFKQVNDSHGHVVGDALLIALVRAIFGQIRQDDLLCRYGGEEFVLILPGTTIASARKLLIRLKNSIEAISYKLDNDKHIGITVSMGIATNLDKGSIFTSHDGMLEAADLALYAAKHAGRNKIVEWDHSLSLQNHS